MKRLILCVLMLSACGSVERDDSIDAKDACFICADGKADNLGLSQEEAFGVLKLVNSASRHLLDVDVALDVRAANNIIDRRNSVGLFTELETLDAVPYVGRSAFSRLRNYAVDHGYVTDLGDPVHGVQEGSEEAFAILNLANTATFSTLDDDVKLDRRAAQNIVDDRPFSTLAELDSVGYVGKSAFGHLRDYVSNSCSSDRIETFIRDINGVDWGSYGREIRTDMSLEDAISSENWPAELAHAGCFGVRPDDVPSWIPVTDPEDDARIRSLFIAFANSAARLGTHTNVDMALEQLACNTSGREFVGCRFEFQPNPFSGITWNIIQSDDGQVRYLFVSRWAE